MDITIFIVNFVWVCWMPKEVPPHSVAQAFMLLRYILQKLVLQWIVLYLFRFIFRCFRPLRIFILVPHMRKVVSELCKGFKEIILVAVLLISLIFIFANYGVHLFGLRMASCNDATITSRYVNLVK